VSVISHSAGVALPVHKLQFMRYSPDTTPINTVVQATFDLSSTEV
jgi:hypothetical protein